jgi:integrase
VAWIKRYERDDGTFRYGVEWRDASGRKRYRTAGPRQRDAVRLKAEIERRLSMGPLLEAEPEAFGAFLAGWLDRHAQRVRATTIRRYREVLPCIAPLESIQIERLTPALIDDLVMTVSRRAPRQAELSLRLVKMVLRDAKTRGQRVDEAVLAVRPPRRDLPDMRFLDWPEVEELAAATPEPYNSLVQVAALTGLRQGELFGLRIRNVDLDRLHMRVDAGVVDGQLAATKTRSSRRTVFLCDYAAELITAQIGDALRSSQALVWTSPEGGPIRKDNFMARVYRPAVVRAGFTPLRFHDLRHTYAALMVRAGAHPKLLQSQMGHASIRITLDLYGHLYPDVGADTARALEQLIRPARGESAEEEPKMDGLA